MLRRTSGLVLRCSAGLPPALWRAFSGEPGRSGGEQWHWMVSQGHHINPCNSLLHPAVKEAGIMPDEGATELPVQAAYTPQSTCFGCGEFLWCFPRNKGRPIRAPVPQSSASQLLVVPVSRTWACYLFFCYCYYYYCCCCCCCTSSAGPAHPDGLHLQSRRLENGLEARITLPSKYCAFPGILNGGILSTLLDCHGNWTAAVALMDRSCLPKPPLTLTASMLVRLAAATAAAAVVSCQCTAAFAAHPHSRGQDPLFSQAAWWPLLLCKAHAPLP
jgi:hypothetical protein